MNDSKAYADQALSTLFQQAKRQFGDSIKAFWFYDGDLCPACLARPIDETHYKGERALSINAFIYRPRGVLIGYFLCNTCANYIMNSAAKTPGKQTALHADIERNLAEAYHKHLASLDA